MVLLATWLLNYLKDNHTHLRVMSGVWELFILKFSSPPFPGNAILKMIWLEKFHLSPCSFLNHHQFLLNPETLSRVACNLMKTKDLTGIRFSTILFGVETYNSILFKNKFLTKLKIFWLIYKNLWMIIKLMLLECFKVLQEMPNLIKMSSTNYWPKSILMFLNKTLMSYSANLILPMMDQLLLKNSNIM